jgi:hypothetical protein
MLARFRPDEFTLAKAATVAIALLAPATEAPPGFDASTVGAARPAFAKRAMHGASTDALQAALAERLRRNRTLGLLPQRVQRKYIVCILVKKHSVFWRRTGISRLMLKSAKRASLT